MLITTDVRKNILCWVIATILPVGFFILMYFLTDWRLTNIFLVPGALYLGYLGLRFVTRMGTFDLFAYQFVNWTSSWRKGSPKKYQDAYEYKNHMSEQRSEHKMIFLPWLVIGLICMILCIVLSFFPGFGR